MLDRSEELRARYVKGIQDAFNAARDFYEDCGKTNGMSFQYELCKMFDSFDSLKKMFDKIRTRVDRHINDVSDPDEFRRMKEQKFTDDDTEKLNSMAFDEDTSRVRRLRTSDSRNIDDVLSDEPRVKRLRK